MANPVIGKNSKMSLLKVEEALAKILDGLTQLEAQSVSLSEISTRQVLANDIIAQYTQPPFHSSAMDGYAVRFEDCKNTPTTLKIVGKSSAGARYHGKIKKGEAVRIFTGAPVPDDANSIIMQEKTQPIDETHVTLLEVATHQANIRMAGNDFKKNDIVLKAGHMLSPAAIALCAASGHAKIDVIRPPRIAILATGDELVQPDETPNEDQIICSNSFGLAQIVRNCGGEVFNLGIARDNEPSIVAALEQARLCKADLLLTSGGVSVGDYDLVQKVLKQQGMVLDFWKIAMRPGKPLMYGELPGPQPMKVLGLPGNPVSSLVCAYLFLVPILNKMSGRPDSKLTTKAKLGAFLPQNGDRRHYLRAYLNIDEQGELLATPVKSQDSSLIHLLANAHCLIIQEAHTGPFEQFEMCTILKPDHYGL